MKKPWLALGSALAFALFMAAWPALADDKWDLASGNDDGPFTQNLLVHGVQQTHDVDDTFGTDFDWMVVRAVTNHSYEARVSGSPFYWYYIGSYGGNYAGLERVDYYGNVLTPGAFDGGYYSHQVARWVQSSTGTEFLRVAGGYNNFYAGPNARYDIEFFDSTYFVPRWNNSGTQITVFLIQNISRAAVTGSVFFYDGSGALVHTEALSVPVQGLQIINTAGIGALAGLSGSAAIAHTGGWGALAGKAVALEPSTGFSFDTALTPMPR